MTIAFIAYALSNASACLSNTAPHILQLAQAGEPTEKGVTLGEVGNAAIKMCRHNEVSN
jgi:hypothetical protein